MTIGGLIAVGVADAGIVAVFPLAPRLLDYAGAGSHNGSAVCAGPVDSGVHFGDLQDGVAANPETRGQAHILPAHRPAHQELARGVALIVVIVNGAIGRAEAIESVR